jgi:photosystem II stability/assembly factor-like uncharacterized protein
LSQGREVVNLKRRNNLAKLHFYLKITAGLIMKIVLMRTAIIFCGLLTAVHSIFAQAWTQSHQGFLPWTGVASSADGTKVVAVLTNGPVWFSTNSGYQWFIVKWTNSYYSTAVTSSEDGTVLAAATGKISSGPLFVSTNSGAIWATNNSPYEYWTAIACSSDGGEIVAVATNGAIYISKDTGNTWLPSGAPNEHWISIACSADGSQLAAVATNGPICVSTNAGATWMTNSSFSSSVVPTSQSFFPKDQSGSLNTNWQAVACSADKTKLVAVLNGGPIYISTNAGSTWTPSIAPSTNWQAVACSADGTKLIAAVKNGPIYTSIDAGATWISNNAPSLSWTGVASSADGSKLVAVVGTVGVSPIYTLQSTPAPQLNPMLGNSNFCLSWTLPSTNFVLQQSFNLVSWSDVTNAPTLNLTNLQNQVTLSPTNSSSFFRLISQ